MTALGLICFCALHASFIWARYAVFRIDGATPRGARLIDVAAVTSIALGIALIVRRPAGHAGLDALALVVAAIAAGVFAWAVRSVRPRQLTAVFSTDKPVELLRGGAFAFVRNPFYLSYILAHAVPLLLTRSPWAALSLACMTALYRHAVALEERKFLAGPLARDYRQYVLRTGRFLPRLSSVADRSGESA